MVDDEEHWWCDACEEYRKNRSGGYIGITHKSWNFCKDHAWVSANLEKNCKHYPLLIDVERAIQEGPHIRKKRRVSKPLNKP